MVPYRHWLKVLLQVKSILLMTKDEAHMLCLTQSNLFYSPCLLTATGGQREYNYSSNCIKISNIVGSLSFGPKSDPYIKVMSAHIPSSLHFAHL